jgi:hypothetical protein
VPAAAGAQRGRHVDVIPRLVPAGQRGDLGPEHVIQVQHRADVHHHRGAAAVEPDQLEPHGLPAPRYLEVGHVLLEPVDHLRQVGGTGHLRDAESGCGQRGRHGHAGRLYCAVAGREQVDVLGGPGDDAVRGQGVTAGQRESVFPGGRQRDPSDLGLELVT